MVEEKLQAAVQHRPLGQVIVVQHQQQWFAGRQLRGQLIEQAVEALFEGERLMALAHFQQPQGLAAQLGNVVLKTFKQALEKAPRVVIASAQAQPQALPATGQALTKLDRQRTLAEAGRCTHQEQATTQPGTQALAQTRARDMAIRQRRAIKTPVPSRCSAAGNPLQRGQISHGRLLFSCGGRQYGCPQTSVLIVTTEGLL
ncbi:hypothetical protein D3C80_1167610 [compost metagenome]